LATLQSEKKSLYQGYKELKDQHTELLNARGNCERLLGINRDAPENTARSEFVEFITGTWQGINGIHPPHGINTSHPKSITEELLLCFFIMCI